MAAVHGKSGSITFTNITAGVKSWKCNYTCDVAETTDFAAAGVKTHLAGGTGWTASAEANWDAANTAIPGNSASLTLTAASGKTYVGTAIITSMDVNVSNDGVNNATYEFQGTGALVITLS